MKTLRALIARTLAAAAQRSNRPSRGQAMTEYALILSGVCLIAIVSVNSLGGQVAHVFDRVGASLTTGVTVSSSDGGSVGP